MKRKIITLQSLFEKAEDAQARFDQLQAKADDLQARIDKLRQRWYLADKKAHFASEQAAGCRGLAHHMEKIGAVAYLDHEGGIALEDWIYPDKTNP